MTETSPWRGAVITGAASGIGRCFAETLAARGVAVGLIDVAEGALEATAAVLTDAGRRAEAVRADVSRAAEVDAAAEALAERLGHVDLVIHCAAILGPGRFAAQGAEGFERVIAIDLLGTANVVRSFLPFLRRSCGAIACLASTAAVHGWPNMSAYSAAKFGVVGFCDAVRPELAAEGIGITTVFPLLIDTPLLAGAEVAPILEQGRPIPPEAVVRKTLSGLSQRRARVYVPGSVRFVALLQALAPSLLDWYGRRFGM
jgi:NAD(P)-dependent dehydrogenase (short-subunit alcohol dehydrogenase family)